MNIIYCDRKYQSLRDALNETHQLAPIRDSWWSVERESLAGYPQRLIEILFNVVFNNWVFKRRQHKGVQGLPLCSPKAPISRWKYGTGVDMNLAFTSAKFVQRAWGLFSG